MRKYPSWLFVDNFPPDKFLLCDNQICHAAEVVSVRPTAEECFCGGFKKEDPLSFDLIKAPEISFTAFPHVSVFPKDPQHGSTSCTYKDSLDTGVDSLH